MSIEHEVIPQGEIHSPFNWAFADSTARLAATITDANQVGKIALQQSDNSIWLLISADPATWQQLTWLQANLSITESQISDLGTYLTSESDPVFTAWDKSTGITITESQISDLGSYLTSVAFTDLTDSPADYTDAAGKLVKVNATGDGLIFGDPSGSSISWGDITGTLSSQTDLQNALNAKLESVALDDITDVTITTVASGEVLKWDGAAWINNTLAEAGIAAASHTHTESEITDLGDYLATSLKGAANGLAELDATTKVPKAQLGTGTADNTKFLRGDGTWAVPTDLGAGIGSLTFYNADGSQDDIDLVAATALTTLAISSEFDMAAAADFRVDGAFGWRDLFGEIMPRGQNAPVWTLFRDGIYLYACPNNQSKEWFLQFHIDHDYAIGTKVYPHIHITVASATANGTVRIGIEYTVAKGHAQATGSTFGATTTVYVEQAITGATDQYKHFVLEVSDADAIPSTNIEPDTVILIRMFTDTGHANYTYTDDVYLIQGDCHYQIGKFATPNKAPDFYA